MAAEIVRRSPAGLEAVAYPVIGAGHAFKEVCSVVGPRSHVPSQGWRHARFSVFRDLPAMAASIPPAIRFLKEARQRYGRIVVVGDAVGIILCRLAGASVDIYVDVFKTGYAHRYSGPELWAMRGTVKTAFCRDDMLASQLRATGIDAVSHGNIMIDTVPFADLGALPGHNQGRKVIGVLPGSRAGAPTAFVLQAEALKAIARERDIVAHLAVADGVSTADLARASGLPFESAAHDGALLGRLCGPGFDVVLIKGATGNVIAASDIVLSQAGTATQQALGLGKPVITYFPPEHRSKRMRDEQALMGKARLLLPPDPATIAREAIRLLDDPEERSRLGEIGQTRLGGPGTLDAIISALSH